LVGGQEMRWVEAVCAVKFKIDRMQQEAYTFLFCCLLVHGFFFCLLLEEERFPAREMLSLEPSEVVGLF